MMNNNAKQIKIGSVLGLIYTLAQAVISLAYIPILLSGIGKAEYGVYQIVGSVIAYFSAMEAPLCAAILKHYSQYREEKNYIGMESVLAVGRRIFAVLSLIFIVLSVPVIYLIRIVYASRFTLIELNEACLMFVLLIINIVISLNNYVYVAAINANERYIFLKTLNLLSLCMQPIGVIVCIRVFPYATTIVVVQVLLNLILAIVRRAYAIRNLGVVIKRHGKDPRLVTSIFKLSATVLVVAFADQVFWKTDQLILGTMIGPEIVAIYSIGAQINGMYISVGCIIGSMMIPVVTRINQNSCNKNEISLLFAKVGRYQTFILGLIVSGVILFGKEFVDILAGSSYEQAYYVALLLMVPYTIDLIQTCAGSIMQVKNMFHLRAITIAIMAVINVVLTIELIDDIGMIGAALATAITIVLGSGIVMNIIYKKRVELNIGLFWKKVCPILVGIVLSTVLGLTIKLIVLNNVIIQFVLHIVLYTVLYFSLMLTIFMNREERNKLFNTIKSIK